jgi:hypothetical protein
MNLLEQIIIYIIEHFTNPIFEPIIIDKKILILFENFVSKLSLNKSNIKLLKRTRYEITKLPTNDFLTVIFHQNFIICIDILIKILEKKDKIISHKKKVILQKKGIIKEKRKVIQQNEITITRLLKENDELRNTKRKFTSITAKKELVIYFTLS